MTISRSATAATPDSRTQSSEVALARLAAIVESSDDVIISKTLEGVITSWNAAAHRLFGYTAEEAIGQPVTMLIPEDLLHEEATILAKIRAGDRIDHYETRRRTRDGRLIDISLTVSPIRDSAGRVIGASKIARDITAVREAREERERLLESERLARAEAERLGVLKDEFLATLSHELRTPLNAILGWCALLREPAFKAVNQRQAVDTIERNARAQAQIIDDLLDMSRIVAGKIRLTVASLSIEELVRTAVDAIRPAAGAKQITLRLQLDASGLVIRGDGARIQQILWNLLTNAVKFTPQQGRVDVTLRQRRSEAEVCVTDNGIGIAPEFLPYVFDRFRQAESGASRHFGGLGLGLSIVRTLVELHGGRVKVSSDGEGKGATFVVCFPLRTAAELEEDLKREQGEALTDDALPRLDGSTLLVVDDDTDSRSLLARVLEGRGARVLQAASANDALSTLRQLPVDVMLSDIGLPGKDGYELIRDVRALGTTDRAETPALAVSAYARPEDRRRAIDAGFQEHIAKPYSIPALLESVRLLARAR
jgi:PAS domain S-box-containing protein